MGILNVTPDSFYAESRMKTEEAIRRRVRQIVEEGGSMIDVGAYSSRPGADDVSADEEMARLKRGMKIVREEAPEIPVSVDTFRADVAKMCIEELGADIINDISGGELDKEMFHTVAKLGVPYILMHMKGTPQTMQEAPHYDDLMKEVMLYFSEKIQQLRDLGQKDIILDPGYGFAKTLDHNYELLAHQEMLSIFELPTRRSVTQKHDLQIAGLHSRRSIERNDRFEHHRLAEGSKHPEGTRREGGGRSGENCHQIVNC